MALSAILIALYRRQRKARRQLSRYADILSDRESDLSEAQQVAHVGSWVLDTASGRMTWSEEMHRIFGITPGEFDGTYEAFLAALHPDDRDSVGRAYTASLTGDGRFDVECRIVRRPDGLLRWGHLRCRHQRDPTGRVLRSVGTVLDITKRKRAEDELATAVQKLAASNAELQQFAHTASHDLQEPLRMVTSYLGLLERRYGDVFDDEGRDFLHFATDGAKRMSVLIQDLLEYARIEGRGGELAPVDTASVMEEAKGNLTTAIAEGGCEIAVDGPLPVVLGDRGQMVRLFQNLISNAVKYRAPDRAPRVRVGVSKAGGEWVFAIADNGIGIAPEHFDKIFVIFQRLHARGEYEGTGVGLAIVNCIVERHGGRIWVDSTPGIGTTFFFSLQDANSAP